MTGTDGLLELATLRTLCNSQSGVSSAPSRQESGSLLRSSRPLSARANKPSDAMETRQGGQEVCRGGTYSSRSPLCLDHDGRGLPSFALESRRGWSRAHWSTLDPRWLRSCEGGSSLVMRSRGELKECGSEEVISVLSSVRRENQAMGLHKSKGRSC